MTRKQPNDLLAELVEVTVASSVRERQDIAATLRSIADSMDNAEMAGVAFCHEELSPGSIEPTEPVVTRIMACAGPSREAELWEQIPHGSTALNKLIVWALTDPLLGVARHVRGEQLRLVMKCADLHRRVVEGNTLSSGEWNAVKDNIAGFDGWEWKFMLGMLCEVDPTFVWVSSAASIRSHATVLDPEVTFGSAEEVRREWHRIQLEYCRLVSQHFLDILEADDVRLQFVQSDNTDYKWAMLQTLRGEL